MHRKKNVISILVLTLNEENNIAACIESIPFKDDIVVLDSFSSDRTVDIARALGAKILQRSFDNWSNHQNWALESVPFLNEWVFYLDADERMTPPLAEEISRIASSGSHSNVAYYCTRRNFFMGRWIRHCYPPVPLMRFFKPKHVRFERLVNPIAVVDGPHGYLKERFDHYNFSKGLEEWFAKHNRYATFEAMEGMKVLRGEGLPARFFSRDRAERIRWLKRMSFHLPFRGLMKFCYLYFFKMGFLDGYPGFLYCRMQMVYEFMIAAKMVELQRKEKGLPI